MQLVAGLCILLFVGVGTAVGFRMLWFARQRGGLPEWIMGSGLVLICTVGHPLGQVSGIGKGTVAEVHLPLWALATLLTQAGVACMWLFTAHVFRPRVGWAHALCASGIGVLLTSFAGSGLALLTAPPEASTHAVTRAWMLFGMIGYAGGFFWTAVEGMRQYRMALRRLALGLADPVVANRFFLWGLFGLFATAINLASVVGLVLGLPSYSLLTLLPMGTLGAGGAFVMYLAFFPPAWYLGWVRGAAHA